VTSPERPAGPNPKRVAAGRRNVRFWRLTDEGRSRLQAAAFRNQPWQHSTGPRTPQGKARSAANGKACQKGPQSVRELRDELAVYRDLASLTSACRQVLARLNSRPEDRECDDPPRL
jgi:hypothetical protein